MKIESGSTDLGQIDKVKIFFIGSFNKTLASQIKGLYNCVWWVLEHSSQSSEEAMWLILGHVKRLYSDSITQSMKRSYKWWFCNTMTELLRQGKCSHLVPF